MTPERRKVWAFLALTGLIALFLAFKTVRVGFDEGVVRLTLLQQKGAIASLDTPRDAASTKSLMLRKIDFPEGRILRNGQYGKMGYSQNFFMDARVEMVVKKAGNYRFDVRSDDGFRLLVDAKTVCQHPGDRPMQNTVCLLPLTRGRHHLALSYFQGAGPMGLQVTYRKAGENTGRYVGENSDDLLFEKSP